MNATLFMQIDPIALKIFHFDIYWYSIAYVFAFIFGFWLFKKLDIKADKFLQSNALDDIFFYSIIGVIVGGRLGYCLFYQFNEVLKDPLFIFGIRSGGMSFHGGLTGLILGVYYTSYKHKLPFLYLVDLISVVAPIGLFLGRIANFVNGELYGRITEFPFGMIFPNGGMMTRHPSQLYEAFSEGVLLFIIMLVAFYKYKAFVRPGLLSGIFLIFYWLARTTAEQFREPDAHIGYLFGFLTMGQLLSLPMLALGGYLVMRKKKKGIKK